MTLIGLLIVLILLGVLMNYLPVDSSVRPIIVVVLVLIVLSAVLGYSGLLHVGRLR